MLDSQPVKSNMSPVSSDVRDFRVFQKSCHGFLARYLSCVQSGRPKVEFSSCSVETTKLRGGKLRRFVVASFDLFMSI